MYWTAWSGTGRSITPIPACLIQGMSSWLQNTYRQQEPSRCRTVTKGTTLVYQSLEGSFPQMVPFHIPLFLHDVHG